MMVKFTRSNVPGFAEVAITLAEKRGRNIHDAVRVVAIQTEVRIERPDDTQRPRRRVKVVERAQSKGAAKLVRLDLSRRSLREGEEVMRTVRRADYVDAMRAIDTVLPCDVVAGIQSWRHQESSAPRWHLIGDLLQLE